MAIRNFKHGAVRIKDRSGNTVNVSPGAGNFSISALESGDEEQEAVYNRADFLERVQKRKKLYTWSITIMHDGVLTAATKTAVLDAIRGTGGWAGTTIDPGLVVHALDVDLIVTRSGVSSTIALANCHMTADYGEGETANQLTINGDCAEGVTIS